MVGYFITFEGGEGAGKTTQAKLLYDTLQKAGKEVLLTREPGGTEGAEALREFLLFGNHPLSLRAEIMTHFAARCDHVDSVIRPALGRGQIVICDRYTDSTMAYQGYGLGKGNATILNFIQHLSLLVGLQPDLTLMFNIPYELAVERRKKRLESPDRYELEDEEFHKRVALGFQKVAEDQADRIIGIDAGISLEDIQANVLRVIARRLPDVHL